MLVSPGSSSRSSLRRPSPISSSIVVHCWPCQPTYWRSSSQIGQWSGRRRPDRRQAQLSMREATLPANPPFDAPTLRARLPLSASGDGVRRLAGGWREALGVGLLATVWSLADRGYAGGRWWDVPAIKSFADPRLYRQDPFVWALHDGTPAAYPYQVMA